MNSLQEFIFEKSLEIEKVYITKGNKEDVYDKTSSAEAAMINKRLKLLNPNFPDGRKFINRLIQQTILKVKPNITKVEVGLDFESNTDKSVYVFGFIDEERCFKLTLYYKVDGGYYSFDNAAIDKEGSKITDAECKKIKTLVDNFISKNLNKSIAVKNIVTPPETEQEKSKVVKTPVITKSNNKSIIDGIQIFYVDDKENIAKSTSDISKEEEYFVKFHSYYEIKSPDEILGLLIKLIKENGFIDFNRLYIIRADNPKYGHYHLGFNKNDKTLFILNVKYTHTQKDKKFKFYGFEDNNYNRIHSENNKHINISEIIDGLIFFDCELIEYLFKKKVNEMGYDLKSKVCFDIDIYHKALKTKKTTQLRGILTDVFNMYGLLRGNLIRNQKNNISKNYFVFSDPKVLEMFNFYKKFSTSHRADFLHLEEI